MERKYKRTFIYLMIMWLLLQFVQWPNFAALLLDCVIYVLLLLMLYSPYSVMEAVKLQEGRRTLFMAAAIVCIGQLLCFIVQMPFIFHMKPLQFLVDTVIAFVFWLLEAEAYCRIQFEGTIKGSLWGMKNFSILIFLCLGLTVLLSIDSLVGSFILNRMLNYGMYGMRVELAVNTVLDKLIQICMFAAYCKVLSMMVHGIKRIN